MAREAPLRCRCGAVRGVLRPASAGTGTRLVCYCDDCHAFARFLGRDDVLDTSGGTDIFQVAPSYVTLTDGHARIACVRLSAKGLHRFYADCCKTPIANTIGARFPFAGVITSFIHPEDAGETLDGVLGEPVAGIHGRFARGGCPPHAHPGVPPRVVLRIARRLSGWVLRREGRPQPFFDVRTRAPKATERVLDAAERAALV